MTDHDQSLLGPYVLGVLEPADVREVEEHLPGCADCRQQLAELEEIKVLLGDVPPEAFLDGPPPDGDLLLQRTLRASRASGETAVSPTPESKRPRWLLAVAASALVAAVSLGGGVLIGQQTVAPVASEKTPPGSKSANATDAATGTTMTTTVEPREGWSWIKVKLTGLEPGAECEVLVTDENGETFVAGSWVVTEKAAREGSQFAGGVLVPIDQVKSVEVKNSQGKHIVTTTI